VLVRMNGWDPAALARLRADSVVQSFLGAIDGPATQDQLEHLSTLIPGEWLSAAARGRPETCAAEVRRQLDLRGPNDLGSAESSCTGRRHRSSLRWSRRTAGSDRWAGCTR